MNNPTPCAACLAATPYNRHGSRTCYRKADWEVSRVTFTDGGFHIQGWNHSSGETFFWGGHGYKGSDWIKNVIGDPRFDLSAVTGAASAYPRVK